MQLEELKGYEKEQQIITTMQDILNVEKVMGYILERQRKRGEKKMTYKIVRYYQDRRKSPRKIKGGLTLKQAQTHCRSPKTRGKDWFDGYTKE